MGEKSLGEKSLGEKSVGEKSVGEKSVSEKFMGSHLIGLVGKDEEEYSGVEVFDHGVVQPFRFSIAILARKRSA